MQVAKSAASLARMGRRGGTHLGNIAPKPASVGKAKLGGLVAIAGKAEKHIAESQVWPLPFGAHHTTSADLLLSVIFAG